ncbi:MAG TPA: NAD(P)/FAD-dependent oxidoreductase [Vicinamibacteria bacterium]
MAPASGDDYDVLIVGGGPAGLSAALILGRCRRSVLLCDSGEYRNAAAQAVHGFLTRDGVGPAEFRRIGREQLQPYETVEVRDVAVQELACVENGFLARLADGGAVRARQALVATGVVDKLPRIAGLAELYGRSVFHCPYCDGWEVRDQPLAVYGQRRSGRAMAVELLGWSANVLLCTDGRRVRKEDHERLAEAGIAVRDDRIDRLEGRDGVLERIVFRKGPPVERRALFLTGGNEQRSDLPQRLGCRFTRKGKVVTGRFEFTNVPGLFVAGDASGDVQLAIIAAAEGARAAFAINQRILKAAAAARVRPPDGDTV